MAWSNTSAGFYANERDLSVRATGQATSIGVIVGEAPMGVVNKPILVTDKAELRDIFGVKNAKLYGFGLYCAEHFLAHSRALYYIRAVDAKTARTAGAYLSLDDLNAEFPVIKLVNFDDGTNQPLGALGDPLETIGFNIGQAGVRNAAFYVCASSPGKWNNRISVQIRPSAQLGTNIGEYSDPYHFYVDVFIDFTGPGSAPVESFLVSRKEEVSDDNKSLFIEDVINERSAYIRVKNNPLCPMFKVGVSAFEFLDGGSDGKRPSIQDIYDAWALVEDRERISVNLLINAGYTIPTIQRRMLEVAQNRGDATAILDLPDENYMAAKAVRYRRNELNVSTSYGAMYAPFVKIRDTDSNKPIWVPPSGLVAAQFAYTDRVKAVFWAPAGISRGQVSVLDIRHKYNQGSRDAMDRAQINIIRKIPGRGFVIMGQDTLQTHASGFQNVNVRRLVNFIKTSISIAGLPSNFNPNDSFERLKLKNMCDSFMAPIKNKRGVYEWETICDERNNKPHHIDNNDIILDLVIDPTIPAKRAHLSANIQPTGASFTEV